MTDDGLLVVALKIPPDANARAYISVGPLGARAWRIALENDETSILERPSEHFFVPDSLLKRLAELGLATREQLPA